MLSPIHHVFILSLIMFCAGVEGVFGQAPVPAAATHEPTTPVQPVSGTSGTEIKITPNDSIFASKNQGITPTLLQKTHLTLSPALRTNLLFDAMGAPNIGIEVPIGKHFSAAADFAYAYWRIDNLYALQTIQGSIEGRYWFRQGGKPLTGWNVGIYGTYGGRYDVQWREGYQGDRFLSSGITGGYATAIGKHLLLDFLLGAGYFFTPEVRHYSAPQDGNLIWEETRYNVGRFALTKVRIGLVWLPNFKR